MARSHAAPSDGPHAEDAVQETWIRWSRVGAELPDNPDAWLTTVATRVALDQLRRRTRERDRYVGPWLPTPMITVADDESSADHRHHSSDHRHDPEAAAELADSLTTAYLLMLERLTPEERAAFLLADVFGEPYRVVAEALGRNEPACRKLASRARSKLRQDMEPEATPAPSSVRTHRRVVDRFLVAIAAGDEADALACVGTDAVLVSDGGPHRRAARHPVLGPARIVRLLTNLARRMPPDWRVDPAMVGGLTGVVATGAEGTVELAVGFVVRDEVIDRAYVVLSPDKLAGARADRMH